MKNGEETIHDFNKDEMLILLNLAVIAYNNEPKLKPIIRTIESESQRIVRRLHEKKAIEHLCNVLGVRFKMKVV